ncbi:hypothetical protein Q0590_25025 [Rhodocytophaga aerolata]|uniref:Uncharacterized protein n=1 Tax=Rhodocytophaga aerolata TaxID=455078 RepID=A0ABT8RBU1_9BACT|nr:hypothetical protein [Rhodocytophaga aerolata]MDO1449564.1 hypothetical protein [Rhodocytophaga aerolata]
MILESMIVHFPKVEESIKQAVIMDYSEEARLARGIHRYSKVEPMFVNYNKLSAKEQQLWDEFMDMLQKNMHNKIVK